MLSKLKSFAEAKLAATSYAQGSKIKPYLISKFEGFMEQAEQYILKILQSKSIESEPYIQSILKSFISECENILAEVKSEEFIMPLCGVIGRNISRYSSKEDFKQQLQESKALEGLIEYLKTLFDDYNYKLLKQIFRDIECFDKRKLWIQKSLVIFLKSGKFVKMLQKENEQLNVENVKLDIRNHLEKLCSELKFKQNDKAIIIKSFDRVVEHHLNHLNDVRQTLLEALSPFFQAKAIELEQKLKDKDPPRTNPAIICSQFNRNSTIVFRKDAKLTKQSFFNRLKRRNTI